MIRKLTKVPRFWVTRGHKQTVIENASTLMPQQYPDAVDPHTNLPTELHYKYSQLLLPMSEIEARIWNVVSTFLPLKGKDFSMDKTWMDLNMDSLDAIAFVCAVEQEFNCVFEETVFDNFMSAREIANHMGKNKYCF